MPDYSDTTADQQGWKALPVPTEDVAAQCRIAPLRVTFKAAPGDTAGWVLQPGEAIPIKNGQAGFIRPETALGGVLVIESIG
ncbi:hypothetical protein LOS78_01905 [Paracoccus sp. MA]|uniref:hypothetical protein n=1 Tax=Paracoccus sp. MA TaxID=2895796 RepID=UPI001E4D373E|nr:hypothetical protein [Paracoccus sp. MA]UFM64254.1 hypothetical protein LOS78_01905 [Paracoccus sp. MA]